MNHLGEGVEQGRDLARCELAADFSEADNVGEEERRHRAGERLDRMLAEEGAGDGRGAGLHDGEACTSGDLQGGHRFVRARAGSRNIIAFKQGLCYIIRRS